MNSYSTVSSKPTSGISDYSKNHNLYSYFSIFINYNSYRFFPSVFSPKTDSIGELFYSLPTSFIFPTPSISNDQIQKFSVGVSLYYDLLNRVIYSYLSSIYYRMINYR